MVSVSIIFETYKKWFFLVALSVIWGSSFILIKKSLIGLDPVQLGSLRLLFSGAMILLVGSHLIKNITRQQWPWVVGSAILGTFFPAFLFAIAETEIDSAVASILNGLVPLNTILFGLALFKIGTTTRQAVGVVIGFMGTAVLIGYGAQLNPEQNYYYAGFVILSTLMYALNINIIKKHLQEMTALTIAAGNFVVLMVPAFAILYFSGFFENGEYQSPEVLASMGYVLILSLFGTAIAKVLFNRLVQMSTPVFASSVTYLMPLVAVLWATLDGEKLYFEQALAAILILFGVYLSNRNK
jgi:drug/metabolite transporter (DMT)-like permease